MGNRTQGNYTDYTFRIKKNINLYVVENKRGRCLSHLSTATSNYTNL